NEPIPVLSPRAAKWEPECGTYPERPPETSTNVKLPVTLQPVKPVSNPPLAIMSARAGAQIASILASARPAIPACLIAMRQSLPPRPEVQPAFEKHDRNVNGVTIVWGSSKL